MSNKTNHEKALSNENALVSSGMSLLERSSVILRKSTQEFHTELMSRGFHLPELSFED